MATNRRAGTLFFKVDGVQYDAKGNFSYNLGAPKREALVGPDRVHGYKEHPQVAHVEGEITDRGDLKLATLLNLNLSTVTLELANGKTVVFREAWYAGDGQVQTDEANIQIRFEAMSAEET